MMAGEKAAEDKAGQPKDSGNGKGEVGVGVWKTSGKLVQRSFPGPRDAKALLRIAFHRDAFAELIAHAKSSLDKEICGVLVGTVCEDSQGPFVDVAAVIRGSAAAQGSTHVTFTQDTWNTIHQALDRDYPKFQMVGWYHTHPGFGVEFSDMDLFIQKNFFPTPTQIALVTDPLNGAVAICVNTEEGIKYIDRFWVDGREQICQVPKSQQPPSAAAGMDSAANGEALRALEGRVSQLLQTMDQQRESFHRFLFFIGAVVCLAVVAALGYVYYSAYRYRIEPPELRNQWVPIPVQVGDKTVLLGVGVVSWQVPEELQAAYTAAEKEIILQREKETNQAGTNVSNTAEAGKNAPAAKP